MLGAGLLALAANQLRLTLTDFGMMLAPAAFFAAVCAENLNPEVVVMKPAQDGK